MHELLDRYPTLLTRDCAGPCRFCRARRTCGGTGRRPVPLEDILDASLQGLRSLYPNETPGWHMVELYQLMMHRAHEHPSETPWEIAAHVLIGTDD